jgi:hypothetical protein
MASPDPPERGSRHKLTRAGIEFVVLFLIIVAVIAWAIIRNAHG